MRKRDISGGCGAMKCCGHEVSRSSPADGVIDSWVGIYMGESRCVELLQAPSRARQASMACTPSGYGSSADMPGEGLAQKWPGVPCAARQRARGEALAISLWLLSATGLSFDIGSGLLALDALRAINVIGIHGFVLFLRSP